jgi:hypothetical protein
MNRVHQAASVHHQHDYSDGKRIGNQHVFPYGVLGKPLFSWADRPSLINDELCIPRNDDVQGDQEYNQTNEERLREHNRPNHSRPST